MFGVLALVKMLSRFRSSVFEVSCNSNSSNAESVAIEHKRTAEIFNPINQRKTGNSTSRIPVALFE